MNILKLHQLKVLDSLSPPDVLLTAVGVPVGVVSQVRDAPSQARAAAGGHGQTNQLPSTHLDPLLALGGARCSPHHQQNTRQAQAGGHGAERSAASTTGGRIKAWRSLIWTAMVLSGDSDGFM